MEIIPRTAWQDPKMPVKGPALVKSTIRLLPAHYTAMAVVPDNTPLLLRNIQRDYTVNRGYSIGYNFAVDKTGAVYECRGFDIKCAANVNRNDETIAILCLVDGAEPMNPDMVVAFKALGAEAERRMGRSLTVVCHCDIGATACPGSGIVAQVKAGLLKPADPPPPIEVIPPPILEEDDMPFLIRQSGGSQYAIVYGSGLVTGLAGEDVTPFAAKFGDPLPTAPSTWADFVKKSDTLLGK